MGADHKGPLAAFVVVAIIAAVLLVTSVRSQAEPGWLYAGRMPTTLVAPPPASALPSTGTLPAGVQHPAAPSAPSAPSATATSAGSAATNPSSSLSATHSTQGPAGHPSRAPGTPRHAEHSTFTQQTPTNQEPADDPTGTPDSPDSSETARHGFDPHRLFPLGHGSFPWHPRDGWPVGWPLEWQRWLSTQPGTHPWGSLAAGHHHHWSH